MTLSCKQTLSPLVERIDGLRYLHSRIVRGRAGMKGEGRAILSTYLTSVRIELKSSVMVMREMAGVLRHRRAGK